MCLVNVHKIQKIFERNIFVFLWLLIDAWGGLNFSPYLFYLSVYLFVFASLSLWPSVRLYSCQSVCMSISFISVIYLYPLVSLSVCLSVCMSVCLSVCLSVCRCSLVNFSVCLIVSLHLFFSVWILSVCLFVDLYVRRSESVQKYFYSCLSVIQKLFQHSICLSITVAP